VKDLIQSRLETKYNIKNAEDELNALKEITQEIALYSLKRAGFFEKACFLGGTCLRIVHSLDRFSEDLDFSTREVDRDFKLDTYLEKVMDIMNPYGYDLDVNDNDLDGKSVQSRFLKDDSIKKVLTFKYKQDMRQKIKIKVEIDTEPPAGAVEKPEFIDFPDEFQIMAYDIPSLMSGKMHALLCRDYDKGRDWYDFAWYVKNGIKPNQTLLSNALKQMGPWKDQDININSEFINKILTDKINSLNWNEIREDVRMFLSIEKAESLELWSKDFFISKVRKLQLT